MNVHADLSMHALHIYLYLFRAGMYLIAYCVYAHVFVHRDTLVLMHMCGLNSAVRCFLINV